MSSKKKIRVNNKKLRKRSNKTNKNNENGNEIRTYIMLIGVALFFIWSFCSFVIVDMMFVDDWNKGDYPFIFFWLNYVFFPGGWGGMFLIAGLFVSLGSIYFILTKKAADPKRLVFPAALLTFIFLGIAYFCLGLGWSDSVLDSIDYHQKGAEEKVIVLNEYQAIIDYGKFSRATDYVYVSDDGEKFKTNTDFEVELYENEKYKISYLPRTKYIVGVNHINN